MFKLARFFAVASLGVGLLACGGSGAVPTWTAPGTVPSGVPMSDMPSMSETPHESGDSMDIGALGQPADAASADRTIQISLSNELSFDPAAAQVKVGETVTFEITNTGALDHEFVLGSPAYQAQHEQEMQEGHMEMGDEPNAIDVPAGTTASLTWQFTEAGTTQFGCHEPGHFAGGMVGDITVTP